MYELLVHFNQFYNFPIKRVSIKNLTSRWGSCSSKGNLNFNYKIIALPRYLQEYLVVHEMCHLKEFNHSEKFWRLVAHTVPDYKKYRKEIRNILVR